MAFGIKREELKAWKRKVQAGEMAFITHYWIHPRYPNITTVTKAGCSDLKKLIAWGETYGLKKEWIHQRDEYPHFDLIGPKQKEILISEQLWDQIQKFHL